MMYEAILYTAVAYILLCEVNYGTITRHVLINIFQAEQISMSYEKTVSFLMMPKSLKV